MGLILSFTLMSWIRGGLKEVLSLVGLGGGFLAAATFYPDLAAQLSAILPDQALGELLSFLMILILGYFGGTLLTGLIDSLGRHNSQTWNRVLGAGIGFCKGVLISMALFWVIDSYVPPFQDELAGSYVAEELARMIALFKS